LKRGREKKGGEGEEHFNQHRKGTVTYLDGRGREEKEERKRVQ